MSHLHKEHTTHAPLHFPIFTLCHCLKTKVTEIFVIIFHSHIILCCSPIVCLGTCSDSNFLCLEIRGVFPSNCSVILFFQDWRSNPGPCVLGKCSTTQLHPQPPPFKYSYICVCVYKRVYPYVQCGVVCTCTFTSVCTSSSITILSLRFGLSLNQPR